MLTNLLANNYYWFAVGLVVGGAAVSWVLYYLYENKYFVNKNTFIDVIVENGSLKISQPAKGRVNKSNVYKIAIYIRFSKLDNWQDTARQLLQLRKFAKSQNWQIIAEIKEHISGKRTKKSETKKLINLAKSNRIQKVLIHEITKLGRNITDTYNTVEELTKNKVSVFDFDQQQETLDEDYDKTLYATIVMPVLSAMAKQWIEKHSHTVKLGLKRARKKGIKIGRPKKDLIKKERQIVKLRKQGFIEDEFKRRKKASYSRIAKYLNVSIGTVSTVSKKHNIN